MERIKILTQEQFDSFKSSNDQERIARELLSLSKNAAIGIGDTAVMIDNAKPLEVYKNTWKGKEYFQLVIKPIDEKIAMCYSIYPLSETSNRNKYKLHRSLIYRPEVLEKEYIKCEKCGKKAYLTFYDVDWNAINLCKDCFEKI